MEQAYLFKLVPHENTEKKLGRIVAYFGDVTLKCLTNRNETKKGW